MQERQFIHGRGSKDFHIKTSFFKFLDSFLLYAMYHICIKEL